MENQQEITLSKYCRILGINPMGLSKRSGIPLKDINVLYNKSVYDFEVFALKNLFEFEPMYAMDYTPPVANNEKLVAKHPFKFTLIDSKGNTQSGTVLTSRASMGIKILKLRYPKSTKHDLTAVPGNWINSVKRMGSAV